VADGEQEDEVLDDDDDDEGVEEADEEGDDEDALGVAEIASDEAANSNPIVSASAAVDAHLPCS
jgi:hypothetical protein